MSRLGASLDILRYAAASSHAGKSLTALLHHTLSRDNTEALRPHAVRVLATMLACDMTRNPLTELKGGIPLLVYSCSANTTMSVAFDVLVDGGVFLDAQNPAGETSLHKCILKGGLTQLTRLLQAGANPNIRDCWGMTPLFKAVANRGYAVGERLLEYGADPLITDDIGNSALSYAQDLAHHDAPQALALIEARARAPVTAP